MKLFQIHDLVMTCDSDVWPEYGYTMYIDGRRAGDWHLEPDLDGLTLDNLRDAIQMSKDIDESFKCLDCGINTGDIGEYYSVEDDVWLLANPQHHGMLCIGCIEERLGRVLTPADFIDYPINYPDPKGKSKRFMERLGYGEQTEVDVP
jgi:hypothetical protein